MRLARPKNHTRGPPHKLPSETGSAPSLVVNPQLRGPGQGRLSTPPDPQMSSLSIPASNHPKKLPSQRDLTVSL